MPERSRNRRSDGPRRGAVPAAPRHAAAASPAASPAWWQGHLARRVAVGVVLTVLATPVLVLDNMGEGRRQAEAVQTVAPGDEPAVAAAVDTATTAPSTTTTVVPSTTTTEVPTTTTTVEEPDVEDSVEDAPVAVALVAPPTTTPPTTAPPTTAPPTTVPPTTVPPAPSGGSVESIIRAHFGAVADQAIAIARCESSLNPAAVNPAGYYGLFQIGTHHAAAFERVTGIPFTTGRLQAEANTRYARSLYDSSGWSQWGCRHVL